jgi:hypothetical protein
MRFVVACVLAFTLAGCGGSAAPDSGDQSASPAPTMTESGSAGPGQMPEEIRECLRAAGIELPSGTPSRRPNAAPSEPPGGIPTGRPSGRPSGISNAPNFDNPQVRAALKACGITLPSPSPANGS